MSARKVVNRGLSYINVRRPPSLERKLLQTQLHLSGADIAKHRSAWRPSFSVSYQVTLSVSYQLTLLKNPAMNVW